MPCFPSRFLLSAAIRFLCLFPSTWERHSVSPRSVLSQASHRRSVHGSSSDGAAAPMQGSSPAKNETVAASAGSRTSFAHADRAAASSPSLPSVAAVR